MKVGDLVRPTDKGWKKYRKSKGIVVGRCQWTYGGRVDVEIARVHWFCGAKSEWSLDQLEIVSENR